jgi:hypothetical protein
MQILIAVGHVSAPCGVIHFQTMPLRRKSRAGLFSSDGKGTKFAIHEIAQGVKVSDLIRTKSSQLTLEHDADTKPKLGTLSSIGQ